MKTDIIILLIKEHPQQGIYLPVKKRGFGIGKHVAVGGGVEAGESLQQAASRELEEETGLQVPPHDFHKAGVLTFHFPARPQWERGVHVYLLREWRGEPVESDELKPYWFEINDIPYHKMWQDARYWLPQVISGESIQGEFTFAEDNESLVQHSTRPAPDYLWLHLRSLPYFRSILRSVEASYYQDYQLPSPVYDLGSGDGHFASIVFDAQLDVGLDPWETPTRQAVESKAYRLLVVADGADSPFPSDFFGSGLSNSVLEHIEHIDRVLTETARILKPGALFLFCVPNPGYYSALSIPAILSKLGLDRLARAYTRWFGRMSRVFHADSPEVWKQRLEKAGFTLEHHWHYFSPQAMRALEWGHYFGLPSLITKILFGRWIIAPWRWNLYLTALFVRRFAGRQQREDGTFTWFAARKNP